jgi:hypothetical protein
MVASMSNNEPGPQRGTVRSPIDERAIGHELHAGNLNRTVSLIGSNLAIFTFVLVLLLDELLNQDQPSEELSRGISDI